MTNFRGKLILRYKSDKEREMPITFFIHIQPSNRRKLKLKENHDEYTFLAHCYREARIRYIHIDNTKY